MINYDDYSDEEEPHIEQGEFGGIEELSSSKVVEEEGKELHKVKEELVEVEDNGEIEHPKTISHPTLLGVHFTTRETQELCDMTEEEIRAEFSPDEVAADEELQIQIKEGTLCTVPDCTCNRSIREPQLLKPYISCTIKHCKEHKLGLTRTREKGMSYYENFMLHTPDQDEVLSMTYEDAKEYTDSFPNNRVKFNSPLEVDVDFDPPALLQTKVLFGHPNLTTTTAGPYVCPHCGKLFPKRDIKEEFRATLRKESFTTAKGDISEELEVMSLETK